MEGPSPMHHEVLRRSVCACQFECTVEVKHNTYHLIIDDGDNVPPDAIRRICIIAGLFQDVPW